MKEMISVIVLFLWIGFTATILGLQLDRIESKIDKLSITPPPINPTDTAICGEFNRNEAFRVVVMNEYYKIKKRK